jgi:hypothetical protein
MAAVLTCGPDAVLSYWSAAIHWGLLRTRRTVTDVSVPGNRRLQRAIRVHRVPGLEPRDCTKRLGIPITTVPRTLFDIAGEAHPRQLRRAVNQADREGWLNHRAIAQLLDNHPRRKGTKALRAVIAAVHPQTHRTRSDLEAAFLGLCHNYGLPTPTPNVEIEGYEVDMHFPGTNLIVELDSYEYHRTPAEFAADRRKDAHLKTLGYDVLRVADSWLDSDPQGVATTIRKLLPT